MVRRYRIKWHIVAFHFNKARVNCWYSNHAEIDSFVHWSIRSMESLAKETRLLTLFIRGLC